MQSSHQGAGGQVYDQSKYRGSKIPKSSEVSRRSSDAAQDSNKLTRSKYSILEVSGSKNQTLQWYSGPETSNVGYLDPLGKAG